MRVRKAALVTSFLLSSIACGAAQAQSTSPTTRFTVGAKVWHAAWLSYLPAVYSGVTPNGTPTIGDSVNAVEGKERTSVLPQIAISYGRFFASVNHGEFKSEFRVNTSPVVMPGGQNLITARTDYFKRRESDLTLGYALTPEFSLALGYKDATETRDTTLAIAPQRMPLVRTKAKGFLVGAVGNFALYEKLRLYAQAAYGPARLKLRFADAALGASKTDGTYIIGEVGLSYPIYSNANGSALSASLGYRTQTVKTEGYADAFQENRDLRDVRDGVVLTFNFTI